MIKLIKKFKRILVNDLYSLIYFNIFIKKIISKKTVENKYSNGVTAVITSCNRPNKLYEMLKSLSDINELNFDFYVFVEDGGCEKSVEIIRSFVDSNKLNIIFHKTNHGQLRSIDEAYSKVNTKYIFHMEEDWIYLKKGFLKYSINVLENNKNIACVSLRPHSDFNDVNFVKENNYYIFKPKKYNLIWRGITINPGIYRKSNYDLLGNYSQYKKERIISQIYSHFGFIGVISNDVSGYVIHNGRDCSTRKVYKVA